jgi:hypothetical protein
MIVLNGCRYLSEDEVLNKDFKEPYNGTYQISRFKKVVYLYDLAGNRIGFINACGVLGRAKHIDNGRYWYSHGNPDGIPEWKKYAQYCNEVTQVVKDLLEKKEA